MLRALARGNRTRGNPGRSPERQLSKNRWRASSAILLLTAFASASGASSALAVPAAEALRAATITADKSRKQSCGNLRRSFDARSGPVVNGSRRNEKDPVFETKS
jgi:hypothetical protein